MCQAGWLVGHGTYCRQAVDEAGKKSLVRIQRMRCRGCRAAVTLLYDFLVPYCKYTVSALKGGVVEYLTQPTSYLEALTEPVSEAATLFGAVEKLLSNLPAVWMFLMKKLIESGRPVREIAGEGRCPNSFRCKDDEKRRRLNWAAWLLELVPDAIERASRGGYAVFARGRGCELLRTHTAECALF